MPAAPARTPSSREQGADVHRPGAAVGSVAQHAQPEFMPYGSTDPNDEHHEPLCEIVTTLGEIELEYAAVRRSCAAFDASHRGTLLVTGKDRRDFLNRMLTQDMRSFPPGSVTEAFFLNRKGRIDADLLLAETGDAIVIDLDITIAAATAKALSEYVFSEDVQIADVSQDWHRIQLHGPKALEVVAALAGSDTQRTDPAHSSAADVQLAHGKCAARAWQGAPMHIIRRDIAGTVGVHLAVPRAIAAALWTAITAEPSVRAIGWYALNIARIEAGTPIFNIDFGSTNLPHETGVVHERVSFKKGCYIGQEIVARMQNLGAPKQQLIGLAMQSDHLPVAGAAVFEIVEGRPGDRVGVITSSTLSPMSSAQPIAFAMLRTQFCAPGTELLVHAEGEEAHGAVHALTFWTSDDS